MPNSSLQVDGFSKFISAGQVFNKKIESHTARRGQAEVRARSPAAIETLAAERKHSEKQP